MQAIVQLGSVLGALGIALGILFSFTLLGTAIRSAAFTLRWPPAVGALWDVFLGTAAAAFVVTVCGMLGWFAWPLFVCLLLVGPLLSVREVHRFLMPWRAVRDAVCLLRDHKLLGGVALVAGVLAGIPAAAPEIFYDALYYHLGLPAQYLIAGKIEWLPSVVHSAFPAYLDMLFGLCLAVGGVAVAKFFNFLLFILGCCATAVFVHEVLNDVRGAIVGAVTVGTIPGVLIMSTMCGIDTALIGFAAMSAIALSRMTSAERRESNQLALLAAVCVGVVVGSKYTGLWLLGALVLWFPLQLETRRAVPLIALFVVGTAVFASPWYLRNVSVTGDPVYPVLSGVWGDEDARWAVERIKRDVPATGLSWGSIEDLATGLVMNPGKFGAGAEPGLLLPIGLAALILGAIRSGSLRSWAIVIAAYSIVWLSQSSVIRYLYPIFPFCALGVGWAVSNLPDQVRRSVPAMAVVAGLAIVPMTQSARTLDGLYNAGDVVALFTGMLSHDDYLERRLAYYPAAVWLNNQAPPDGRVYYLGETRLLYLNRPVSFSSAYDHSEIARLLTPQSPPFFDQLKRRGVTHMVIHGREIERLRRSYDYLPISGDEERRLRGTLAQCRVVFSKSGVQVCELPR